jgi:hypothetical protein
MKIQTFKEFNSQDAKVVCEKDFSIVRDGGSHIHKVVNQDESGYCMLKQDFGIHSEKEGTREKWYLAENPPNHTKWSEVSLDRIHFV